MTTGVDLRKLKSSLDDIFSSSEKPSVVHGRLVDFIVSLTGAGAVSLDKYAQQGVVSVASKNTDLGQGWAPDLSNTLRQGSKRVLEKKQVAIAMLAQDDTVSLIAVPVTGPQDSTLALSVALKTDKQPAEIFIVILQLVAQCLSLWHQNRGEEKRRLSVAPVVFLEELHRVVSKALENGEKKQAGPLFVQGMKEFFQADIVMLAPGNHGVGKDDILHSSISDFNAHSPQMKSIKQVVAECRQQKRVLTWGQGTQQPETLKSLVLRDMAASFFVRECICFPLLDSGGNITGVLLICWNELQRNLEQKTEALHVSGTLIGGFISWLSTPGYSAQFGKSLFSRRQRYLLLSTFFLTIVLLGFLPVNFKVSGNCVLEPSETRFVVAQFDGILKKVHTLPGSEVREGDLLAEFDERVIEIEINSLLAEIQKTRKMQDVHRASGKTALAQMAGLEKNGLEEKLHFFQERLSKLSVKSPVDGIIISENLERIEGSPISLGQGLFEVAPLKAMIAEAHISQEDISYVQLAAKTDIHLESFPNTSWQSSVHTIFPRSELRNGRNVFLVESLLENSDNTFRPGMAGEFAVTVGKKPLAWKLFRRPWIYFQKTFLTD